METETEGASRLPSLGPHGEGWVAGQMLLIFAEGIVSAPAFQALPPSAPPGWISLLGGALVAIFGLWLVYRGIGDLGPNVTAMPRPRSEATLVESGVYARIRHPIYAGVMACGIGWAFLVVSLPALLLALLLVGWLDLKSRREEAWLSQQHPGYRAYRSRTRRFVPGLY